jgi:hypothetical protein
MKGKKTGGRRAGTPNKTTRAYKEAVMLAFQGIGGQSTFQKWAKENLTDFYTKIATRLIPTEVSGNPESPVTLQIELTDASTPHPEPRLP